MQIHWLQVILFMLMFLAFNHYKLGLRYQCLFFMPLYAMTIANVSNGLSTNILPIHIWGLALFIFAMTGSVRFQKSEITRYYLTLLPFIVSLIYNLFFFEPIRGWEIQGENRIAGNPVRLKTGLSLTNLTQLVYIMFGMVMALIYSSIQLDKMKLKKVIDLTLFGVVVTGTLQFVSFYSGMHENFKFIFYTIDASMVEQRFLWDWKRINGTFQEPSYLGHFLFFSYCFYLLCFGYQAFTKSMAVRSSAFIGILSTATTFYLGAVVLLGYMYFQHTSKRQKMLYYITGLLIIPIALYTSLDTLNDYFTAKQTSTNNRFEMGWTIAWEGIKKSPFLGTGYGTHRPLFIYTQLLSAIGILGTLFFIYALLQGRTNQGMRRYLLLVFCIGIGAFEMTRHEMWIYFGLLANPWLYHKPNSTHARIKPNVNSIPNQHGTHIQTP